MLKIDKIANDILTFFVIALSGSLLHVVLFTPTLLCAMLCAVLLILFKKKYPTKLLSLFAFGLIAFVLVFGVNFLFSDSKVLKDYIAILIQVFVTSLILLAIQLTNLDFKYHLYRLLKVILILSVVGFILSFLRLGTPVSFIDGGYKAKTMFYLFYYYAEEDLGFIKVFRSQGIFWEPGILAIYANIHLLLSLFIFKSKKNVALAIICIFTTLSTTGFFLLFLQFLFYIKNRQNGVLQKMLIPFLITPLLIVAVNSYTEKKAVSEDASMSSYGLRAFDLYSGAMIAVTNPFFGVGINKDVFLKERNKLLPPEMDKIFDLIEERGNSNSLLMLFYSLGIIWASFWLYSMYRQEVVIEQRMLFFLLAIIGLSSEPLAFTPFFLYFTINGFQNILNRNEPIPEAV